MQFLYEMSEPEMYNFVNLLMKCVFIVRASPNIRVYLQRRTDENRAEPFNQCSERENRKKGLTARFYTLPRTILNGSTGAYVMSVFGHGSKRDMPILISANLHTFIGIDSFHPAS